MDLFFRFNKRSLHMHEGDVVSVGLSPSDASELVRECVVENRRVVFSQSHKSEVICEEGGILSVSSQPCEHVVGISSFCCGCAGVGEGDRFTVE